MLCFTALQSPPSSFPNSLASLPTCTCSRCAPCPSSHPGWEPADSQCRPAWLVAGYPSMPGAHLVREGELGEAVHGGRDVDVVEQRLQVARHAEHAAPGRHFAQQLVDHVPRAERPQRAPGGGPLRRPCRRACMPPVRTSCLCSSTTRRQLTGEIEEVASLWGLD